MKLNNSWHEEAKKQIRQGKFLMFNKNIKPEFSEDKDVLSSDAENSVADDESSEGLEAEGESSAGGTGFIVDDTVDSTHDLTTKVYMADDHPHHIAG